MIHYFKTLPPKNIAHDVHVVLADNTSVLKKIYSMTTRTLSKAILKHELLTQEQPDAWIKELEKIEHDKDCIVLMHPIIAVWGAKAATASLTYIY